MPVTFEITQNGVYATYNTNEEFKCGRRINGAFVIVCNKEIKVEVTECFPQVMQIFNEVSQEICNSQDPYSQMAWAHIVEPIDRNSDPVLEIYGTENAISMIQHGLDQNEIMTIEGE